MESRLPCDKRWLASNVFLSAHVQMADRSVPIEIFSIRATRIRKRPMAIVPTATAPTATAPRA